MKKSIIAILLMLCYQLCFGQTQKSLSIGMYRYFVSTDNAALMYHYRKEKNEWGIGIKYHFNKGIWDSGNINQRNMYTNKPKQNWGLMGEYRRYLFNNKKWNQHIQPYIVYNLAISYKDVQGITFGYSLGTGTYDYHLIVVPNCWVIDSNLGFGVSIGQYNSWSGFLQAGIGFGTASGGRPESFWVDRTASSYSYMLSGGIKYNLNTPSPEKKKKNR